MKLRRMNLSDIVPDPENARTHPERNLEVIESSLKAYGQVENLVVQRGTRRLIAGHGRLEALRRLGKTSAYVLELDVDDQVARRMAVHLNRSSDLAGWEPERLENLLVELKDLDIDPATIGFTDKELEDLIRRSEADKPEPAIEEDEAPPLPAVPKSRPGDLYRLGNHRILCGDSTMPATFTRLFQDAKPAQMVFTDPPWNVAIGTDKNPKHRQRAGLVNDDLSPEEYRLFLANWIRHATPFIAGDVYCILGAAEWPTLDSALRSQGYHWSATIIWVKDVFVLGRSKYHRRYEPMWYGWHGQTKSSHQGARDVDDVWEIPRPKKSTEHPTMKPVALAAKAITNSSRPRGVVHDPFLGSGSTLIAAEQLGRACYGIEIDPGYVDVSVQRWEALTGRKAVLERAKEALA